MEKGQGGTSSFFADKTSKVGFGELKHRRRGRLNALLKSLFPSPYAKGDCGKGGKGLCLTTSHSLSCKAPLLLLVCGDSRNFSSPASLPPLYYSEFDPSAPNKEARTQSGLGRDGTSFILPKPFRKKKSSTVRIDVGPSFIRSAENCTGARYVRCLCLCLGYCYPFR